MSGDVLLLLAALIAAGLFAGFAGGLFGIGGGAVLVPTLYLGFAAVGVDEAVRMHLAVGTSLSTIIVTSWRSLGAHAKVGAVDYEVLRRWAPWIAFGAIAGAGVANFASTSALLLVFGVGLLVVALHMAFGDAHWRVARDLPTGAPRAAIAASIGLSSALMGIGGGAFGVAAMTLCGRPIHHAVATASGFGAAIAVPGALGYMLAGWGREGLPWGSLGFVSAPAFLAFGLLVMVTAPLGARMAHRLPQATLKRAFAVLLALLALNMLREAFS